MNLPERSNHLTLKIDCVNFGVILHVPACCGEQVLSWCVDLAMGLPLAMLP